MTTYIGRDALIEAACNGSLDGHMVATVVLAWGDGSKAFQTRVQQDEAGSDVVARDIQGQNVALFSPSYNNLTIHTFKSLTIQAGPR